MKKTVAVLITLFIVFSTCFIVLADDFPFDITPSKKSMKPGESVEVIISVNETIDIRAAGISVELSNGLKLDKGEFLYKTDDALMKKFDKSKLKGIISYGEDPISVEGDFVKLTISAKKDGKGKQTAKITMMAQNSELSTEKTLTITLPGKNTTKNSASSSESKTEKAENSSNNKGDSSKSSSSSSPSSTEKTNNSGKSASNVVVKIILIILVLALVVCVLLFILLILKRQKNKKTK